MMKKILFGFLIVVTLALVVSGCTKSTPQNTSMKDNETSDSLKDDKKTMPIFKDDMEKTITPRLLAGSTTPYFEFTQAEYEKALAENKTILLYFYANWCPICKVEQLKTNAAFEELQLPNVAGFRVNYKDSDTDESEEALAKEFGITYQHTKVIIKNGERVLKDLDSWDKERYITELTKYA